MCENMIKKIAINNFNISMLNSLCNEMYRYLVVLSLV